MVTSCVIPAFEANTSMGAICILQLPSIENTFIRFAITVAFSARISSVTCCALPHAVVVQILTHFTVSSFGVMFTFALHLNAGSVECRVFDINKFALTCMPIALAASTYRQV